MEEIKVLSEKDLVGKVAERLMAEGGVNTGLPKEQNFYLYK